MKIYKECDVVIGTVLKAMIIDFFNKMGVKMIVGNRPPIGEWYAPKAKRGKPIDQEIADCIRDVIEARKEE